MKLKVHLLFLFILFSAFQCADKAEISTRPPTLVGRWQLVEYYMSSGGPGAWTKADPAKPSIVEFKEDGKYISHNKDCNGKYTAANDQEIKINGSCKNGSVQQYELSAKILPSGELVIVPTNPMCIEGCAEKYKSIK